MQLTENRNTIALINDIVVTKFEKIINSNSKKVIYDFGKDLTEYRYLVEDWQKSYNGGWKRVHMEWPDVHIVKELQL